jgi:hypothetical protein
MIIIMRGTCHCFLSANYDIKGCSRWEIRRGTPNQPRAFLRHAVDNALDGEIACAAAGEISFLLFLLKWGARSFCARPMPTFCALFFSRHEGCNHNRSLRGCKQFARSEYN